MLKKHRVTKVNKLSSGRYRKKLLEDAYANTRAAILDTLGRASCCCHLQPFRRGLSAIRKLFHGCTDGSQSAQRAAHLSQSRPPGAPAQQNNQRAQSGRVLRNCFICRQQ